MNQDNMMLKVPCRHPPTNPFKFKDKWTMPRNRTSFYLTHDFHPYFAAFPPELVYRLLSYHSKPGHVLLDPFMGGGTSIVEGVVGGHITIGSDVSPLSKLICSVKATPIKIRDTEMTGLLSNIRRSLANRKQVDPSLYSRISNVEKWFNLKNLTELDTIYSMIQRLENVRFQRFATVAFSNILRKASNAKNAEQHICIDPLKTPQSAVASFESKILLMKKQMDLFYNSYKHCRPPTLYTHDARSLSNIISKNYADIVVTSPPYGVGSKYTNIYKLNYEWLKLEKPRGMAMEHSKCFSYDLRTSLQEIYVALKPGKYCFFVYGDPSTDRRLTGRAIQDAKEIGFKHAGHITCPIKKTVLRRHIRSVQYIPKEFIIIFQKPR